MSNDALHKAVQRLAPKFVDKTIGRIYSRVQEVLQDRADPDAKDDGQTCLHYVLQRINELQSLVDILLRFGASPGAADGNGNTPLTIIASSIYENRDIMEKFIRGDKLDVNKISDSKGWTSLHWAAWLGKTEIVRLLLSAGASPNCKNNKGDPPLMLVMDSRELEKPVSHEQRRNVVHQLVEAGADINAANSSGWTSLNYAYEVGDEEKIKFFLMFNKGDVNAVNSKGKSALHYAALDGKADIVRLLLSAKALPDLQDNNGITPLLFAINSNDPEMSSQQRLDIIRQLVQAGADVNKSNWNSSSSLHLACERGDEDLVECLLSHNASVSAINKDGYNALHIATEKKNVGLVSLLIAKGANVDVPYPDGKTVLHRACVQQNVEIAKLLLSKEASVTAVDKRGYNALHIATEKENVELVSLLIAKGANVDVPYPDGKTVLHRACVQQNVEIAKLLLSKEASVTAVDEYGYNALHIATEKKNVGLVSLLIAKGANVDVPDPDGKTVLHRACGQQNVGIAKLLVLNRASVTAVDEYGYNALHIATRNRNIELVSLLIDEGAIVDAPDIADKTSLHHACARQDVEIAKLLLSNKASVTAVDKEGYSALHVATRVRNLELVSLLIDRGAIVDAPDIANKTSLHHACAQQDVEIAKLLLLKKASVTAVDKEGYSALHVATRVRNLELVSLLIDNGAIVDAPDIANKTSLHHACALPDVEIAKLLLSKKASVTDVDKEGNSALHVATRVRNLELVSLLLENGSNVNFVNRRCVHGEFEPITALHVSIQHRDKGMLKFLLKNGADPNLTPEISINLLRVSATGVTADLVMLRKLLKHKANMYATDPTNPQSFFEYLVRRKNAPAVRVLLEKGLQLRLYNPQNSNKFSPLHEAVKISDKDSSMLSLLLKYNTSGSLNLEHEDQDGNTPLCLAIRNTLSKGVELLLKAGADPNHVDSRHDSPLVVAMEIPLKNKCCLPVIEDLVKAGAKVIPVLKILFSRSYKNQSRWKRVYSIVKSRILFESWTPVTDPVEHERLMKDFAELHNFHKKLEARIGSWKDLERDRLHRYRNSLTADEISHKNESTTDEDGEYEISHKRPRSSSNHHRHNKTRRHR